MKMEAVKSHQIQKMTGLEKRCKIEELSKLEMTESVKFDQNIFELFKPVEFRKQKKNRALKANCKCV